MEIRREYRQYRVERKAWEERTEKKRDEQPSLNQIAEKLDIEGVTASRKAKQYNLFEDYLKKLLEMRGEEIIQEGYLFYQALSNDFVRLIHKKVNGSKDKNSFNFLVSEGLEHLLRSWKKKKRLVSGKKPKFLKKDGLVGVLVEDFIEEGPVDIKEMMDRKDKEDQFTGLYDLVLLDKSFWQTPLVFSLTRLIPHSTFTKTITPKCIRNEHLQKYEVSLPFGFEYLIELGLVELTSRTMNKSKYALTDDGKRFAKAIKQTKKYLGISSP